MAGKLCDPLLTHTTPKQLSDKVKSFTHNVQFILPVGRITYIYTVYQKKKKNDSDVAHYNFNPHQRILIIFGRDIAERICY